MHTHTHIHCLSQTRTHTHIHTHTHTHTRTHLPTLTQTHTHTYKHSQVALINVCKACRDKVWMCVCVCGVYGCVCVETNTYAIFSCSSNHRSKQLSLLPHHNSLEQRRNTNSTLLFLTPGKKDKQHVVLFLLMFQPALELSLWQSLHVTGMVTRLDLVANTHARTHARTHAHTRTHAHKHTRTHTTEERGQRGEPKRTN